MSVVRKLGSAIYFLPRNLAVGFMLAYRKLISPLYGNVCRYYPSCSRYALESFQRRGFVTGTLLSGWRVLRCNPFSAGGIDDPKPAPDTLQLSRLGFVSLKPEESRSPNA
jgi:putative membrane protein insertion efficiency factor